MTRRLPTVALWLLAGHILLLALFWALLQVPESSIWMLGVSAALVLALTIVAGAVHGGAVVAWTSERPVGPSLLSGVRLVPAFLAGITLFVAIWFATAHLLHWHSHVAGQIDAWIIAKTGRTNTAWLHRSIFWIVQFLRWTMGLTLSLSLVASFARVAPPSARRSAWLRSAARPSRWLEVTFWFVLLIAIPWQFAYWRPARLPLAAEPWFVGAKLATIALAMSVGWALVLRAVTRPPRLSE